jgi:hypothetical protein
VVPVAGLDAGQERLLSEVIGFAGELVREESMDLGKVTRA